VYECTGILCTQFENTPALKFVLIAGDDSLNALIENSNGSPSTHGLSYNYLENVLLHFVTSTSVRTDFILHFGSSVSLLHELKNVSILYESLEAQSSGTTHEFKAKRIEQLVRECCRRQWTLPENKLLYSRGSHLMFGLGNLSSLACNGMSVKFLKIIRKILSEYEIVSIENGQLERRNNLIYRLQDIAIIVLDTLTNHLDSLDPDEDEDNYMTTSPLIQRVR
jgi:hypothetical protein